VNRVTCLKTSTLERPESIRQVITGATLQIIGNRSIFKLPGIKISWDAGDVWVKLLMKLSKLLLYLLALDTSFLDYRVVHFSCYIFTTPTKS
jgi:hypothetical protein